MIRACLAGWACPVGQSCDDAFLATLSNSQTTSHRRGALKVLCLYLVMACSGVGYGVRDVTCRVGRGCQRLHGDSTGVEPLTLATQSCLHQHFMNETL